jgi:hypothetical protein
VARGGEEGTGGGVGFRCLEREGRVRLCGGRGALELGLGEWDVQDTVLAALRRSWVAESVGGAGDGVVRISIHWYFLLFF